MLAEIAKATGIRFELQSSSMLVGKDEAGRATQEELFVTTLAWAEMVERISKKVGEEISLAGVPHLMTTSEAHAFLFDPSRFGKSCGRFQADFPQVAKRGIP